MQMAMRLDKNYPPSTRSHTGNFHSWRRWIQNTKADYKRWWTNHEEERARGGRLNQNRRPAKYNGGPSQLHHLAEEPIAEPAYGSTTEQIGVNRIVRG